jgi:hypothetical protein
MKTIALTMDGFRMSIPDFIKAIQKAKDNPELMFSRSIKGWWPANGEKIRQEYLEIINDKINKRGGLVIRELRDLTWYRRAQILLNGNFIVREHDLPPRIRARFESRIYRGEF